MIRYVYVCFLMCVALVQSSLMAGCGNSESCPANEKMFNDHCVCTYGFVRIGGSCVPAGSIDGDVDIRDNDDEADGEEYSGEEEQEQSGPEPCDNPGDIRIAPCGINNNGTIEQICVDGFWKNNDYCHETDICEQGTLRDGTVSCGDAGHYFAELCIGSTWIMSSECRENETCVERRYMKTDSACGINDRGVYMNICEDQSWRRTDMCIDPDMCENGISETLPCGFNGNGSMQRVCTDGAWEISYSCVDPDICHNGNRGLSEVACGLNGRGRVVLECVNGQYSDAGICLDYDICTDGTETTQPCGRNFRGETTVSCSEGHWGALPPAECDSDPDECVDGTFLETGESCGLNGRGMELRPCAGGQYIESTLCRDPDSCTDNEIRESVETCGPDGSGHYTETCLRGGWIVGDECSVEAQVALVGSATTVDTLADTGDSIAIKNGTSMYFEMSQATSGRELYSYNHDHSVEMTVDQVNQYPERETPRAQWLSDFFGVTFFTREGRLWYYTGGSDIDAVQACFPQCQHLAGGNNPDCPTLREEDFLFKFDFEIWFTSSRGLCRFGSDYVCIPACGGGIYTQLGVSRDMLYFLYNGEVWSFDGKHVTRLAPGLGNLSGGAYWNGTLILWQQTGGQSIRLFGVNVDSGEEWEVPLDERMGRLAHVVGGGVWFVARDAFWHTDGTVENTAIVADMPDIGSATMQIHGWANWSILIDARYGYVTSRREYALRGLFRYTYGHEGLEYIQLPPDEQCRIASDSFTIYYACPGETILYRLNAVDSHFQPIYAFNHFVGFVSPSSDDLLFKVLVGNDLELWHTSGAYANTERVSTLQRMVTVETVAPDRLGLTAKNGQIYFARLYPEPPEEDQPPSYTLQIRRTNEAGNGIETITQCTGYHGDAASISRLMVFDDLVWVVGAGGYTPVGFDSVCNTVAGEFMADPVEFDGLWYYLGKQPNTDRIVLYRTDGTAGGTVTISSWSAASSAGDRFITGISGHIFVTTETPEGLRLIKEVTDGGNDLSSIASLDENVVMNPRPHWAAAGDSIFFNAEGKYFDADAGTWTPLGYQVWKYTPDTETTEYIPVNEGATNVWSLNEMDGDLYFLEAEREATRLYVMKDGETPRMLQDGLYMYDRSRMNLIPCGDVVYLLDKFDGAPSDNTGKYETPELWAADNDGAWPLLQADFGSKFLNLTEAVCLEGRLYFNNYDPVHGMELWATDADAQGARLYQDVAPGPASSFPHDFRVTEDKLFFIADDGVHGPELWVVK